MSRRRIVMAAVPALALLSGAPAMASTTTSYTSFRHQAEGCNSVDHPGYGCAQNSPFTLVGAPDPFTDTASDSEAAGGDGSFSLAASAQDGSGMGIDTPTADASSDVWIRFPVMTAANSVQITYTLSWTAAISVPAPTTTSGFDSATVRGWPSLGFDGTGCSDGSYVAPYSLSGGFYWSTAGGGTAGGGSTSATYQFFIYCGDGSTVEPNFYELGFNADANVQAGNGPAKASVTGRLSQVTVTVN
jgi:hypothetical protein